MMRPAAKALHFVKARIDEKRFGRMFRDDTLGRRPYPAVGARPIDDEELACRLQDPLDLGHESLPVLDLKEGIREDRCIHRLVAKPRAALLFDVAPQGLDNAAVVMVHALFNMFQHILADLYRVDPPFVSDDRGRLVCVVPAPAPQIDDLHPVAKRQLEHIFFWLTEVHHYKNTTRCPSGRSVLRTKARPCWRWSRPRGAS